VEDKILTNFLPDFCFKDSAHKIQQQENQERIDKEYYGSNSQEVAVNPTQLNTSINYVSSNNLQIPSNNNEFLQRKKSRSGNGSKNRNSNSNKKKQVRQDETNATTPAHEVRGVSETVGVKLVCDSPNEELQKYFSKTVKFILTV
jgi:hypothetical protein